MLQADQSVPQMWRKYCADAATALDLSMLRKNDIVINVFDHVSADLARKYYTFAHAALPADVLAVASQILHAWDVLTGGEISVEYGMSLTATKYLALIGKLIRTHGACAPDAGFCEIGGGFGGFAVCVALLWGCHVYVVDFPEVCACIRRIADSLHARVTCVDCTGTFGDIPEHLAIVVSEHAWSECPPAIRHMYVHTIFNRALKGWLACNLWQAADASVDAVAQRLHEVGHQVIAHPDDFPVSDRTFHVAFART